MRKMKLGAFVLAFISGVLLTGRAMAQGDVGAVAFPNSGAPAAQKLFLHGLAQLHNFEYDDAAQDFRKAEEIDSGFAMAFWGEAMTKNHAVWQEQDLAAAREVLHRLGPSPEARLAKARTQREKDYLGAIEILYGEGSKPERDFRYADAMEKLHQKYPDDPDAAAFYALALLGTAHEGRDIPTYMRAAAILEDVFYAYPQHPGAAHYLIHSFDDPVHAVLGLGAARAYSKIAPNAAHAQHMTSHIFLALGMWDDTVRANEVAVATVNRTRQANGMSPVACGHYSFWLEYGYLQQGRFRDAKRVLEGCRAQADLPGTAGHGHGKIGPDNSAVGSFVQMRTRYLLDAEEWSAEVKGFSVDLTGAAGQQFNYEFASGFAAARRGELAAAEANLRNLDEGRAKLDAVFDKTGIPSRNWVRKVPEIQRQQLHALILAGAGHAEEAIAVLQKAAAEEETMPSAFGPPVVDKPSDELLGEIFLKLRRPAEARAAFDAALKRAPRRALSLVGLARAYVLEGDAAKARTAYQDFFSVWKGADPDNLELKGARAEYAKL